MDYLYIRAWGRLMGSRDYYVDDQVALARKDKAPADATFKRDSGYWATVTELRATATDGNTTAAGTLERLEHIVSQWRQAT